MQARAARSVRGVLLRTLPASRRPGKSRAPQPGRSRSLHLALHAVARQGLHHPGQASLNGLDWPVPFDEFPAIFERLGWEKQRRKGGITSLPVSLRIVSAGELDGETSRIEFRVSDTLPGTSAENRRLVEEAIPARLRWYPPVWDLNDGRQIRLIRGDDMIGFDYWSKRTADIERAQRRMGIDPANDLDESRYPPDGAGREL